MTTYETRRRLTEQTNMVGREWTVMSIPGRENADGTTEATIWFATNRVTRKSSQQFATYDEALHETRKRNGLIVVKRSRKGTK